ncbi:LPS sulfotransferase NodH [Rhodococcus sp. 27YEA15]|uniref:trehalose 2-sulfotransferase n=1 Tax=Rhodococcus sp. 27YEA15 TaxID=3156259 RepID=UPI003C7CE536
MTLAQHSYLVCASQRSGSTLLVESLRATGVAGEPEEFFQYLPHTSLAPQPREWFASVTDESILRLLAPLKVGAPDTRTSEQWREDLLAAGRTDNGVWGGKLMWNQTPLVIDRAAGLPVRSGTDLRSALRDVLGEVTFIHVHREDVIPQAVSMWKAVQTQIWRDGDVPEDAARVTPEYHPGGIAHLVSILADQERQWRRWFAEQDITPLEIGFRELTADPQAVVGKTLTALGLDARLAPPPPLRRQSDGRSNEWVQRYRADAEENGYPLA